MQSHTVGPCSLTQVVTVETLKAWGDEGLDAHVRLAQREYAQRAQRIVAACERHLAGLAQWSHPSAGMFIWLRLQTVQGEFGLRQQPHACLTSVFYRLCKGH